MDNKKESLIGLMYKPFDNSYAINLTKYNNSESYVNNSFNNFLAGTSTTEGVICEIVSDPFKMIINRFNGVKEVMMIMVSYNNEVHCVMYDERVVLESTMLNGIPLIWDDNV